MDSAHAPSPSLRLQPTMASKRSGGFESLSSTAKVLVSAYLILIDA